MGRRVNPLIVVQMFEEEEDSFLRFMREVLIADAYDGSTKIAKLFVFYVFILRKLLFTRS
jgi:hypothetical protein